MTKFLSQAWFDEVAALNDQAGDLNLPPSLANVILNAKVSGATNAELHLKDGKISQGLAENALSTISIDDETISKIIGDGDVSVALEAFMMGKIRVDGDMTQLMTLQSAKASSEQKALYKQIKAMTEF